MKITSTIIKKGLISILGSLLIAASAQAVVVVNPRPASCHYYPNYNYLKCYYPNQAPRIYYPVKTVRHACPRGICVTCFNYPTYHCYQNPNRLY